MPSSARETGELAFVGAGSLGQAFAGLLARSGQPVTLLATPETLGRLRDAGTIRLRGVVTLDVPVVPAPGPAGAVGVTDDPTDLPRGAGVLFATKGHQLRAAAAHVRAAWPAPDDRDAWVGGLQNGMAKDDVLAEIFGAAMVVGAVTILGGERRPEGEIAVASLGCTYLGEIGAGRPSPAPGSRKRSPGSTRRRSPPRRRRTSGRSSGRRPATRPASSASRPCSGSARRGCSATRT